MAPKKNSTLTGTGGGVAGTASMYPCPPCPPAARPARARRRRGRVLSVSKRVLLLSWEYPPVIEGGLARHVRKLAEALGRQGMQVDVLTRGMREGLPGARVGVSATAGVAVHRVPEPGWPRELERFVAWVECMNEDMLAAGEALAEENTY